MPRIADVHPVFLSCQVEGGALILAHAGIPLANDETLVVPLKVAATTTVAIADFEYAGHLYRIHAYTEESDGSETPWERTSEGVRCTLEGVNNTEYERQVRVHSSVYAPAGNVTARQLADFDKRSMYVPTGVKIRVPKPEDSKPGE